MSGSKTYRPKFGIDIRIKPDVAPRAKKKATQRCGISGCKENAEWRVPKTRESMDDRIWLCRDHLRQHNENWNFFAGMTDEQIQLHCVEALTGHRPTWPLGKRAAGDFKTAPTSNRWSSQFEGGFSLFEEAAEPAHAPKRTRLTKGQLDALAALSLEENATLHEVKARYKELVKRFHPDANGGDRSTEERLKQVIRAYGHLRATKFVL